MKNLVMVWWAEGRWLYDCQRCFTTDSRADWREIYKLAREHASKHIGVGFNKR